MFSGIKNRALLGSCLVLSTAALAAAELAQPGLDDYSTFAFVRNDGQFRPDIAFVARTRTEQLFVLNDGRIVHAMPIAGTATAESISALVVLEALQGAATTPRGARADKRVTWLRTAASPPIYDGRAFTALEWPDSWPGIDMELQIDGDRTERVFHVAPGADWKQIALIFEGVRFERGAGGALIARAGDGLLTLSAPVAFQDTAGGRVPVDVDYLVSSEGTRVSFDIGPYDERLPVTIDPVLQATYFGFGGQSAVTGLAVDPVTGDLIAAGITLGLGVPGLAGGFQNLDAVDGVFVARIDAKLQRVIQSSLIQGSHPATVRSVAIHPLSGEIYVAGRTNSAGFPGGGGGAAENLTAVRDDGYVSRFSPDLRRLLQTTFTHQATLRVHAHDLAINATTGDVYVAGEGFPGAAFVLRFNRELTVRLGRAVLDGSTAARSFSLDVNQDTGDVYVAGGTSSEVFPQTAGGVEPALEADGEGVFVARFNADLSRHFQSTYLPDVGPHINVTGRRTPLVAIHPLTGEVYVAGISARTDLPAVGGAQPEHAGEVDIVVTRLSPELTQRRGATYFGGSSYEEVTDLAFTPDGAHLYLTGFTHSSDLPGTTGGAVPVLSSRPGAFVVRLSESLATLLQTTYFQASRGGRAVTIHPLTGEVYLGGQCGNGIPETTGGLQPIYDGRGTAFGTGCLARFDALLAGVEDADPDAFSFTDQFGVAPGAEVTSAPLRIEGITVPVTAIVSNGSFSIEGGPFDAAARELRRGESIRVRHTAAAAAGTATDTVFSVGSQADTFTSTSATGADSAPDPFLFEARSPVAMAIDVISGPIVVAGIDTPATVSIANGEFSIDGGSFSSAPASISGGQSVVVRHTSSDSPGTENRTTLTIGGVSAEFSSTTDPVDDSVHPISVADLVNVAPDTDISSEAAIVIGINVPVTVSVSGAEWSAHGGPFTSGPGVVENLRGIRLRARSGPPGTTVTATLTVGDQADDWILGQPMLGDTTPDPFSFLPVSNATPQTRVYSNDIVVTGIDVPVWIDTEGAGHFLDPASGLYLHEGFIANGATTNIRVFTPLDPGFLLAVPVRIGTEESVFEVRNAGADLVPDPFDFIDQSGIAPGTRVVSNTVRLSGLVGNVLATVNGCELSVQFADFDTAAVMVFDGSDLRLRTTAPAAAGATASCSLEIGGVVDQFRVTTLAPSGGSGTGGGESSGGGGGTLDHLALACLALLILFRARKRLLGGPYRYSADGAGSTLTIHHSRRALQRPLSSNSSRKTPSRLMVAPDDAEANVADQWATPLRSKVVMTSDVKDTSR